MQITTYVIMYREITFYSYYDSIRAGQMTCHCVRCVASAPHRTVCTALMGKGIRATPMRTDTLASGETLKPSVRTEHEVK